MIREYTSSDKEKCLAIFESNCPTFFDVAERDMFINWLDHQEDHQAIYKSPTYTNSEKDAYYVVEDPVNGIIGCGGLYILKNEKEARLAWGMIHRDFHRMGYGTALYHYRKEMIQKDWPDHILTLGTSQHTFSFYQKVGMKVVATIKSGYGPDLDRYDMVQ